MFFKKPCTPTLIYLIYLVLIIAWHISSCFTDITMYYQIISYLNTKNNVVVMLVLSTILFLIFSKRRFAGYINIIYTPLLFIFLFCVVNTDITKSTNTMLLENVTGINTNLLNGLMLIHPPILYFGYSYILFVFTKGVFSDKITHYNNTTHRQPLKTDLLSTTFILLISISLGG